MNGSLVRRHGSEAGIALPMTLILMALITSLTVAFLAFTSAEPVIASNQMANAQARALAETGVERALWALSKGETTPAASGALADPLPAPVPAPYDGSQWVAVGVGEFKVTVTNGAATNERNITAVGYVPNHTNPVAIKKIQTTVTHVKIPTPPCALCAGGEQPAGTNTQIQVGGSASITASTSNGAVYCAGSTPSAAAYAQGTINTNGHPAITGPAGGSGILQNQPNSNFTNFLFSDADINTLKALAKANGTYYQGSQTWTSPPPNGIIVVDTPSGNPLTNSSPSSDLITVDIHGNWGASGWTGWLVVAGSIHVSGNVTMSGLIYAQNDIDLHGAGGGSLTGAIVSTNRVDTSSTNVDTDDVGNAPITYNCPVVQNGGGAVPVNWFLKPGTFREVAGS
jgi:Tfp pilus assembly protein PilX